VLPSTASIHDARDFFILRPTSRASFQAIHLNIWEGFHIDRGNVDPALDSLKYLL
jgi:hypothetical protein